MTNPKPEPLAAADLFHACDAAGLGFETSAELEALEETIGQARASEALDFAIGIQHEGYNLYVMGSVGLGKHWLVNNRLSRGAPLSPLTDWCYVANFDDPHKPRVLRPPVGRGRRLKQDMKQLVEDLLNALPAAFQSSEYRRRAQEINDEFKTREEEAAQALAKKARDRQIALLHTPAGYSLAPIKDEKMLSQEEFESLPKEEQARIEEVMGELKEDLKATMSRIPIWQREMRKRFKALDQEVTELTVNQLIEELEKAYSDLDDVQGYIASVKQEIIDQAHLFRLQEDSDGKTPSSDDPEFTRFQVNVLVDNTETEGAPVLYEDNPTYQNLVGRIEHVARLGTLLTDFTQIKSGVLHRTNGGYLVLDADKLLTSPFSWQAIKRILRSREIRIESVERLLSLASTITLEPQPIPVDVKIVLVGDRMLYYLLKAYDPEFTQLFKVAADFSEDMNRRPDNDRVYARLIASLQRREGLRDLSSDGVARVIESSARRAGDGDKLSLHIGSLLDLLQESDYWAEKDGSSLIKYEHVQQAIDAQLHRVDQLRERIREEILEGTLMIDTEGAQLGRINGLTLIQLGEYAFGVPCRISATARIGSGDVIDVQREIEQSGPIHSKGVFILSAYLARRYAKFEPLSLSASLVFEQTYGWVEGDSASAAELCVLLSALGDIPLTQSLAVTGSVNQHGELQAIGGVCEKIEGFYDVCRARGLTGEQGVIIPSANKKDLMLRRELVEKAAAGEFHVYSLDHVEQAMELLTGLTAGVADEKGKYPSQSINGRIQARLSQWTEIRHQLAERPRGE